MVCRCFAKSISIHSTRAWFQLEITGTFADSDYRLREQAAIDPTGRGRERVCARPLKAFFHRSCAAGPVRESDRFVANVLLGALLAVDQKKESNRDDAGRDACYE